MLKLSFIFTFLFCFSVTAQEQQKTTKKKTKDEVIKTGAIKEISKLKQDRLNLDTRKFKILREKSKTPKEIILEQIEDSGTFYGAVKAGVSIVHIEEPEALIIPQNSIFKLYNMADSRGWLYIISENGEVYYRVRSKQVSDLRPIMKLNREPSKFTRYKKAKKTKVYDDNLSIFFQGAIHRESVGGAFAREATSTNVDPGVSLRYQFGAFIEWLMPAELGLTLEWENTTYNSNVFHNITNKSMNLGIAVRSKKLYLIEGYPLRFGANLQWSPIARLTANSGALGNTSANISQNALELYTQVDFENGLGDFFIGTKARMRWQRFSEIEDNFNNTNTVSDVSFGIFIGQGFSAIW